MDYLVTGRRRAYAGLAAMAMGAVTLVGGLSGAAGATGGDDPPSGNEDCPEGLVELIKIEAEGEVPEDGVHTEGDFSVTIDVEVVGDTAFVSFSDASSGVSAVIVKSGSEQSGGGSNISEFDPPVTEADDLESPNDSISHITFCGKDDTSTTSSSTPDESTTSSTPDETTTTSTPDETTTSSTPDDETTTTSTPDDETTTTMDMGVSPTTDDDDDDNGGLPVTGSNTGLMVAIGAVLLVGGGALLATSRLRRAHGEA